MWRLILRGALFRRRRFVLGALAVMIGVGFVSGTVVLSQSVRVAYTRLLSQVTSGVDVYVRGPENDRHEGITDFAPIPNSLLVRVRSVPGVAAAQGQVVRLAALVNEAGRFLGTDHQTYGYSWPADSQHSPFVLVAGRAPERPGEVVIDQASAASYGLRIGQPVRVGFDIASPAPATLVGLVVPREGGNLTDATAVFISATWAQSLTGIGDQWDLLELNAARGVSPDELRARVAAFVPNDGTAVITSREYADAEVQNLSKRSHSINSILLAVSGLAVLVAAAVILNTHRVVLMQRTQELVMLRLVGATRRQLYGMVVGEGAVVGLVASAVGALLGIPISYALRGVLALTGQQLASTPLTVDPVLLLLVVAGGTVVTTAIAAVPALSATRVAPLAAVRRLGSRPSRGHFSFWSVAIGGVIVVGALLIGTGLTWATGARVPLVVAGGIAIGLGAFAALPLLASPAVRAIGHLTVASGAPGLIARSNMVRDPRRTAAPAAALAVGLGLVTCVSVLASSTDSSVTSLVQRVDKANLVVVSDAAPGIDPEAVGSLREAPDIATVAEMGSEAFTVNGHSDFVTALEPETAPAVLALNFDAGKFSALGAGTIFVTKSAALAGGYQLGDIIQVRFDEPQVYRLRIAGIVDDNGITQDWIISWDTFGRGYPSTTIRAAFILARKGVSQHALDTEVSFGINGFPGYQVDDGAAYARARAESVEGPVGLIQALVALSIVVAIVAVMNAMALAVVERSTELGLLRIVGMTRAQISLTVYIEAGLTALLGVVVGIAAGLLVGVAIVQALSVQGITETVVPWLTLMFVGVGVVGGGLLAAFLPARRASHAGVLAMAAEHG